MIARAAIAARATEWGLTEEVVEKEYVLGWLLWGIGSEAALRDHWIFKGGTWRSEVNHLVHVEARKCDSLRPESHAPVGRDRREALQLYRPDRRLGLAVEDIGVEKNRALV